MSYPCPRCGKMAETTAHICQFVNTQSGDASMKENADLKAENKVLRDALEWLIHLHNGVSKDGSYGAVSADEWEDAIKSGQTALEGQDD